jgi:hypothetical protein
MSLHTATVPDVRRAATPHRRSLPLARTIVGGFFLVTGGVHLGLVAADPDVYRHFADDALFAFVVDGWRTIVMVRPELYGLLLMAGEVALGAALLIGGRAAYVGWTGVIAFHVLLLVFGWGMWAWAVPALVVLVPIAVRDIRGGCRP